MSEVFDPLSYENLGASIARALDEQPVEALVDLPRFNGAGIYALYYEGDFEPYTVLAGANKNKRGSWAIYIGKAEADSTRKGDPTVAPSEVGEKLWKRLQNHLKSITQANNLDPADFYVRRLVVSPTWVSLAESIALRLHHPVWNTFLDGLGNHDPGRGRYKGMMPRWDLVHVGRSWAVKMETPRPETVEELHESIRDYLQRTLPSELN